MRLWVDDSRAGDRSSDVHSSASAPTSPVRSTSFAVHRVLVGHNSCLWHCSWSRDDSMLIACGASTDVSIWDTATGQLRLLCDSGHREPLHSAYFVDGDRAFVTASPDKQIIMRDLHGAMLHRWSVELSTDMHVTHNQRFILSATQQAHIEAIDVKSKRRTQSTKYATAQNTTRQYSAHSSSTDARQICGVCSLACMCSMSLASASPATAQHLSGSVSVPLSSPTSSSSVSSLSCFLSCFSLSDDDGRALVTATQPAVSTRRANSERGDAGTTSLQLSLTKPYALLSVAVCCDAVCGVGRAECGRGASLLRPRVSFVFFSRLCLLSGSDCCSCWLCVSSSAASPAASRSVFRSVCGRCCWLSALGLCARPSAFASLFSPGGQSQWRRLHPKSTGAARLLRELFAGCGCSRQ